MRTSVAALALIRRAAPTGDEYLTQWNEKWGMYSLVGGHVEGEETFRECCVREVAEELELALGVGFAVAERPMRPEVEYTAMSGGLNVMTLYRVALFAVELRTPEAVAKVSAMPENRWLTLPEVSAGATTDGKPVSAQVTTVFTLSGVA